MLNRIVSGATVALWIVAVYAFAAALVVAIR